MFVKKSVEIFKRLSNIFGIVDDILIVDYNKSSVDHDRIPCKVANMQK